MAEENKVISLEAHRKKTTKGAARQGSETDGEGAGATTPDTAAVGDPVPGRLIWLHCPTCNTLEYTEMPISGGRVHNLCGNLVLEAAVEMDLRAEYTIAGINLERLRILSNLLEEQRRKFGEYRNRISLAAGKELTDYPVTEGVLERLPIAEVDAFGLLVSAFFDRPRRKFDLEEESPSGEGDPPKPDNA